MRLLSPFQLLMVGLAGLGGLTRRVLGRMPSPPAPDIAHENLEQRCTRLLDTTPHSLHSLSHDIMDLMLGMRRVSSQIRRVNPNIVILGRCCLDISSATEQLLLNLLLAPGERFEFESGMGVRELPGESMDRWCCKLVVFDQLVVVELN